MGNKKIDLKRLTEQDWERYRKMDKIASRRSVVVDVFYWTSAFIIIIVMGYILIHASISQHPLNQLTNYSIQQFNVATQSQNLSQIYSIRQGTMMGINNNTVNSLITSIQENPRVAASFSVASFFLNDDLAYAMLFAFLAELFIGVYWFLFIYIPNSNNKIELPRNFKTLRRYIASLQKREANLREYGFAAEEIAWYYAVRSELIKLKLEYEM